MNEIEFLFKNNNEINNNKKTNVLKDNTFLNGNININNYNSQKITLFNIPASNINFTDNSKK